MEESGVVIKPKDVADGSMLVDRIRKFANGNFGCAKVCLDFVKGGRSDLLDIAEKYLNDGEQLYRLYNDICGQDLDSTIKALEWFHSEKLLRDRRPRRDELLARPHLRICQATAASNGSKQREQATAQPT